MPSSLQLCADCREEDLKPGLAGNSPDSQRTASILYNISQYALATPRVEDDGPGGGGIEDNGGTFYRRRRRPPYAKYIRQGKVVDQETQGKYAYAARVINTKNNHFCSGVIISQQNVLSSRSCVRLLEYKSLDDVKVQAGMLTLQDTTMKVIDVQEIIEHTGVYNKTYVVHDIAIIILKTKNKHQDHLEQVTISWSFHVSDIPVTIIGWGDGEDLMYAETYSISIAQCKLLLRETSDISAVKAHSTVGCLHHYLHRKVHSESNDKGGPVIHNGQLIGILNDNFRTDEIDFFTKVAFYRTWIFDNTVGVDHGDGSYRRYSARKRHFRGL